MSDLGTVSGFLEYCTRMHEMLGFRHDQSAKRGVGMTVAAAWRLAEEIERLRFRNAELEEALRQTESSARLRWANHRIEELERQVGRLRSILRPFAVSAVKGGGDVPPEADWQRVAEEMGVEP